MIALLVIQAALIPGVLALDGDKVRPSLRKVLPKREKISGLAASVKRKQEDLLRFRPI